MEVDDELISEMEQNRGSKSMVQEGKKKGVAEENAD